VRSVARRRRGVARELVLPVLGDLYEDQGLYFATERGTLVNPINRRQRSFVPLRKTAELPTIRFHDLRHTWATLLLSGNTND
jgi:integrase